MKESIYIVNGKNKSALINLATYEIRSIANIELSQLDDNILYEEDITKYINKKIDVFEKEILDIYISKETFNHYPDIIISRGKVSYHNVRIVCNNTENEIKLSYIKSLIKWINEHIYHFGVVIVIYESYNIEKYKKELHPYKLIVRKKESKKRKYRPKLYAFPTAIYISKKNNLYHYSRDSIFINEDGIEFLDHDVYNISKNKIENCKNCEFRLNCYDFREIHELNGKYYYDTSCIYE